jgi:DNA-binding beta-propeller fold protein YncE
MLSFTSGTLTWPQDTARTSIVLGTGAGQADGALFFPISVDRGPDGRYFVLDAGNARIQVFDGEGNYLTQWGRGEVGSNGFDFGHGNVSTDFVGSIAVDDDGFIYVADVGNRRIQKFAP